MISSTANDVKIYNLSAGKSLPEWMSSTARRKLEKSNIDVRRRIQLIQDFEMPDVSHSVCISPDGRYVFASGSYKPWLKCYDLNDLSLKFQRGLDADVVKVLPLSDDYSKVVILEEERYIELHASFGRYFRMRMPRFGRDMAFSRECSDLNLVGAGSEIYRLNLEQGEWLPSLKSESSSLNCCAFNDYHQLFLCGTCDGTIEAWDHRDRSRVGLLECSSYLLDSSYLPEATAVSYKDALCFAVGTSDGNVLTFDLRSRNPLFIKNHNNGLPIRKIDFVSRDESDLVLSMDSRVLKMWQQDDGRPFAAIEGEHKLNDFVRYPKSGLLFFATEAPRMLQYFLPQLGPSPKWCSFLETITEELEESEQPAVYDDFTFVTRQQLEDVGLAHLVGSSVLRAYMHGYFIDARLYNKAKTLTQPFAYNSYMDRKIKNIVEDERTTSVIKSKSKNLPEVNKELMQRLHEEQNPIKGRTKDRKKAEVAKSILSDDRFKGLFENTDFEIDEENQQFVRAKAQSLKSQTPLAGANIDDQEEEDEEADVDMPELDDKPMLEDINENSDLNSESDSSDDTEEALRLRRMEENAKLARVRREEKKLKKKQAELAEKELRLVNKPKKFSLHELSKGESTRKFMEETVMQDNVSVEELTLTKRRRNLKKSNDTPVEAAFGGQAMTFKLEKKGRAAREERELLSKNAHKQQRKELARPTTGIIKQIGRYSRNP